MHNAERLELLVPWTTHAVFWPVGMLGQALSKRAAGIVELQQLGMRGRCTCQDLTPQAKVLSQAMAERECLSLPMAVRGHAKRTLVHPPHEDIGGKQRLESCINIAAVLVPHHRLEP